MLAYVRPAFLSRFPRGRRPSPCALIPRSYLFLRALSTLLRLSLISSRRPYTVRSVSPGFCRFLRTFQFDLTLAPHFSNCLPRSSYCIVCAYFLHGDVHGGFLSSLGRSTYYLHRSCTMSSTSSYRQNSSSTFFCPPPFPPLGFVCLVRLPQRTI